jgi:hypothetical protein
LQDHNIPESKKLYPVARSASFLPILQTHRGSAGEKPWSFKSVIRLPVAGGSIKEEEEEEEEEDDLRTHV